MTFRNGNPRLSDSTRRRSSLRLAGGASYGQPVDTDIPDIADSPDGSSEYATDSIRSGSTALQAAHRKRKKHKRTILISVICVLAILFGGGAAAYAYLANINDNLHNGIDGSLLDALIPVDTPTDPFYVLLLGTDGSSEREQSEEYGGSNFRSDSMMLARIDPKTKKVTLVSIPRDTKVDLGKYGTQKINAAHAFGGPALAVKTVSELAGVPIAHYAELNFDGFSDIVDALGGVDVNVPMEINDNLAGGHLDSGQQTLSGDQALILARSRHNYDDYGDGDALRAANQRLLLSAIAQKLLSVDPLSMANTVTKLTEFVTTDLDISEIIAIAQSMRGLNATTDIYTGTAPTESEYTDNIWYEILDEKAFKKMMQRVDQGLPPTEEDQVDKATGIVISSTGDADGDAANARDKQYYNITKNATIRVRNGNGQAGVCSDIQSILEDMGYSASNIDTGNAESFNYDDTIIVYKESKNANEAQLIAETLGTGKAMADNGTYLFDSDFLIVAGNDWN